MIDFFLNSSLITQSVGLLLFVLLFLVFFIVIVRLVSLYGWISSERDSLDAMIIASNKRASGDSFLARCNLSSIIDKNILDACYLKAEKESTKGLTFLSIVATTSPFIGLFGTVVGILDAFSTFSDGVTLSIIAPAISEALIATAMGILVAVPAYAANLTIKRKAYEVCLLIKSEIGLIETLEKKDV